LSLFFHATALLGETEVLNVQRVNEERTIISTGLYSEFMTAGGCWHFLENDGQNVTILGQMVG